MDGLTVPDLLRAIALAVPDRTCLVQGERAHTFGSLWDRSVRVANALIDAGAAFRRERDELHNWESGQDHVALMLRNGPEYLECMLGSFVARVATFNVNFRYTVEELVSLFADARPAVVVVHDEFATSVRQALDELESAATVLQVTDDTHAPLCRDAVRFAAAVEGTTSAVPREDWSPDDLYILFTGGTTGMPKGVLWRQADALVACFSVTARDGSEFASRHDAVARATLPPKRRVLATPPFIHGAAQWMAIGALLTGNQVVIQQSVRVFDPAELMATVQRDGVTEVMLVGDAFGRPIVDSGSADVPTLRTFVNGGAALSPAVREGLLERFPGVRVVDNIGSSESGRQATRRFTTGGKHREFQSLDDNVVVSEDRSRVLQAGETEIGWLAKRGRVPLGYLGDPAKTTETFPVVNGERYAVPGDRARSTAEGEIDVLGRDSTTINTGGEKVFGEEVAAALMSHGSVRDALVLGRPSPTWGQEVVALVATSAPLTEDELAVHAARTLARYKLPKRYVFVREVPRTTAGKPDHPGAQRLLDALGASTTT